jgi:NDP-sugar pyrophosphorylase family protein
MGFAEKTNKPNPGLVNGGVYIFDQSVCEHIPPGPCSLEKDIFPALIESGLYAQEQRGVFIDIGTPADYARAQEIHNSLNAAARRKTFKSVN